MTILSSGEESLGKKTIAVISSNFNSKTIRPSYQIITIIYEVEESLP